MNAPIVWILAPILTGGLLLVLRRFQRLVWVAGTGIALLLALAAAIVEFDTVFEIGPFSIEIQSAFQVLGRQFILADQDRQALVLVFLLAGLGFLLAPLAEPGSLLIPLGLIVSSLVIAALSVDPFLYAALFIEMIVLISVPLLVAPGTNPGKGAVRFLSYQTLGVPFILFSGRMLAGSEGSPGDFELVLRAAVLLGVGFAFFLAVFPFHSWLPMVFEETHPYVAAFVSIFILIAASLFGIELFNRFVWLRNSQNFHLVLRIGGLIMLLIGGAWAAFSAHLGRAIGFALMTFTGIVLLTFSLGFELNIEYYFPLVRSSALAVLIWSVCLRIVAEGRRGMGMVDLRGAGRASPIAAAGLVLAALTLAGYPILASYPQIARLLGGLSSQGVVAAAAAAIGLSGIAVHGLRGLGSLASLDGDDRTEESAPGRGVRRPAGQQVLLGGAIALMLLIGML